MKKIIKTFCVLLFMVLININNVLATELKCIYKDQITFIYKDAKVTGDCSGVRFCNKLEHNLTGANFYSSAGTLKCPESIWCGYTTSNGSKTCNSTQATTGNPLAEYKLTYPLDEQSDDSDEDNQDEILIKELSCSYDDGTIKIKNDTITADCCGKNTYCTCNHTFSLNDFLDEKKQPKCLENIVCASEAKGNSLIKTCTTEVQKKAVEDDAVDGDKELVVTIPNCENASCYCDKTGNKCQLLFNATSEYNVPYTKDKCGCNNYTASDIGVVNYSVCNDERVLNVFRLVGFAIVLTKIIAPLLLMIFGVIELSKAIIASDDKAISNAVSLLAKKAIASVIIFFIPTIVDVVYSLVIEAGDIQTTFHKCQKCLVDPRGDVCTEGMEEYEKNN